MRDAPLVGLLALLRFLDGLFDVVVALDSFGVGCVVRGLVAGFGLGGVVGLAVEFVWWLLVGGGLGLRCSLWCLLGTAAGVDGFARLAAFDDLCDAVLQLGLDVPSFASLGAHTDVGRAVSVDGRARTLVGVLVWAFCGLLAR